VFINQDVDLDNWPNVKAVNTYASESVWIEGLTVKITLRLKDYCGDKYCDAFISAFSRLTGYKPGTSFLLKGQLQPDKSLYLEADLPDIEISSAAYLRQPKFVMSLNSTLKANDIAVADTFIQGRVDYHLPSEGVTLSFFSKIDAQSESKTTLEGRMSGVYS